MNIDLTRLLTGLKKIARELPSKRIAENSRTFGNISKRYPDPSSINPRKGRKVKVKARGKETIQFGRENIDLGLLEQLLNREQTKTIGDIIVYALKNNIIDGKRSIGDILNIIFKNMEREGLGVISPFGHPDGDYVKPRPFEVGAALNRLRALVIKNIKYDNQEK